MMIKQITEWMPIAIFIAMLIAFLLTALGATFHGCHRISTPPAVRELQDRMEHLERRVREIESERTVVK